MTVAGHYFGLEDTCTCGKRFSDIAGVTADQIDQDGWAHTGRLTQNEYNEIQSEKERRWEALVGVCSGV